MAFCLSQTIPQVWVILTTSCYFLFTLPPCTWGPTEFQGLGVISSWVTVPHIIWSFQCIFFLLPLLKEGQDKRIFNLPSMGLHLSLRVKKLTLEAEAYSKIHIEILPLNVFLASNNLGISKDGSETLAFNNNLILDGVFFYYFAQLLSELQKYTNSNCEEFHCFDICVKNYHFSIWSYHLFPWWLNLLARMVNNWSIFTRCVSLMHL